MDFVKGKLLNLYIKIRTSSAYTYLDGVYKIMAAIFIGMSVMLLFCKIMTTTILQFAESNIKNMFDHPILKKIANMSGSSEVVTNETGNNT